MANNKRTDKRRQYERDLYHNPASKLKEKKKAYYEANKERILKQQKERRERLKAGKEANK